MKLQEESKELSDTIDYYIFSGIFIILTYLDDVLTFNVKGIGVLGAALNCWLFAYRKLQKKYDLDVQISKLESKVKQE